MSHNSKNARQIREAKQWSARRKNGNAGPSRTQKVTTKYNTWYNKLAKGITRSSPKKNSTNEESQ